MGTDSMQVARLAFEEAGPLRLSSAQLFTPEGITVGRAFFFVGRGHLVLASIEIQDAYRGMGYGTAFMTQLCAAADANGWTTALTPDGYRGSSVPRLIKFYRRFGFVPNKGRKKDFTISEAMYRIPQEAVGAGRPRPEILKDPKASVEEITELSEADPVAAVMHPNCPEDLWWKLAGDYPLDAMQSPMYPLALLAHPDWWQQLEGNAGAYWISLYATGVRRPTWSPQEREHRLHMIAADYAYRVLPLYEEKHHHDLRPREAIAAAWSFGSMAYPPRSGFGSRKEMKRASYAAYQAAVESGADKNPGHPAAYAASDAADPRTGETDFVASAAYHARQARGEGDQNSDAARAELAWQWHRLVEYLLGTERPLLDLDEVGAYVPPGVYLPRAEDDAIEAGARLLPPRKRYLLGIDIAEQVLPIYEADMPGTGRRLRALMEEFRAEVRASAAMLVGAVSEQDPEMVELVQYAYDRARQATTAEVNAVYFAAQAVRHACLGNVGIAARDANRAQGFFTSRQDGRGWQREILHRYLTQELDEAMAYHQDLPALEGDDHDITRATIIRAQAYQRLRGIFELLATRKDKGLLRKAEWVSGRFQEMTQAYEWFLADAVGGPDPMQTLIKERFAFHPQEILNAWVKTKIPRETIGAVAELSVGALKYVGYEAEIMALLDEARARLNLAIAEKSLRGLLEALPVSIEAAYQWVPHGLGGGKKPLKQPGQLRELEDRLKEFANELRQDPSAITWDQLEENTDEEIAALFTDGMNHIYEDNYGSLRVRLWDHVRGAEWILDALVQAKPANSYLRVLLKEIAKSVKSLRRFDETYQALYGHPYD
jgi:hypothetical protein